MPGVSGRPERPDTHRGRQQFTSDDMSEAELEPVSA